MGNIQNTNRLHCLFIRDATPHVRLKYLVALYHVSTESQLAMTNIVNARQSSKEASRK